MFKKIRKLADSYQQGKLDSLSDNAYLMTVVLISLIYEIKIVSDDQLKIIFQDIITVLYNLNPDFRRLRIQSSDIERVYKEYSSKTLSDTLETLKDLYTPGGVSYSVLMNELKLNENQILGVKNEIKLQILSIFDEFYSLKTNVITRENVIKHQELILSKL